jgi:hypothetical protein
MGFNAYSANADKKKASISYDNRELEK